MKKRNMLAVILVVVLIGILLKVPMQPRYGEITTDREIKFSVFGNAKEIIVDDNPQFYSPVIKSKPFTLNLDSGEYYWKADNSFLIGKFTIQSNVNVRLDKIESDKYKFSNLGNVPVNIDLDTRTGLLTGAAIVDFGNSLDLRLENTTVVIASQSD